MTTFLSIVLAILIFGLLIFIHEAGHFIFARVFNVPVTEFAIGMGPKVISKKSKKTGTVYSLRAIPFGGFTGMVGEDDETDDPNALNKKPIWQRFIIIAAGSLTNLIAGIIVMSILVMTSANLPTTTIFRFFDETSGTASSGLMIGDKITKIDGVSVHIANDMVYEIMRNGTEPVDVTVKRGDDTVLIEDVSFPTIVSDGMTYGTTDFYVASEAKTLASIAKHSFYRSASTVKMIWQSLFDLVTGRYSVDAVSGPVGVTAAIGETAKESLPDLVYLTVVISMNLGIMNLLPLPALDGGRIVFLLIEAVRRKPIKPEYEGYVHFAGIVVLMAFMLFITFKDIAKLIVK